MGQQRKKAAFCGEQFPVQGTRSESDSWIRNQSTAVGTRPVNTSVGWTPPLTLRQTFQSITVPNKTLLENRY